jgi:hypothetical protein
VVSLGNQLSVTKKALIDCIALSAIMTSMRTRDSMAIMSQKNEKIIYDHLIIKYGI